MQQYMFDEDKPTRIMDRHLAEDDRPIYRADAMGYAALSDAETLANILQTPDSLHLAQTILADVGGIHAFMNMGVGQLAKYEGIGRKTAHRILAGVQLGWRMAKRPVERVGRVTCPADAAAYIDGLIPVNERHQEHFGLIMLNTRNQIVGHEIVYRGTKNTIVICAAEVFRPAVINDACVVILFHNHPSGDPNPSPEDVTTNRTMMQAGSSLDIQVMDHIIIGEGRWLSLKSRGFMD